MMETLHRLAGVQDVSTLTVPAQGDEIAVPQVVPTTSAPRTSGGANLADEPRQSQRASLPLNRQPSRRSLRSNNNTTVDEPPMPPNAAATAMLPSTSSSRRSQGRAPLSPATPHSLDTHDDQATEDEGDFAWGPTHPCFPHPNPHCTPGSDEAQSTRVIRVRRDWLAAGDRCPQFANLYPEILDPWVSDEDFRFVVSNLNAQLQKSLAPTTARAWADAILGVATGFLWDDLGFTGAKRNIKKVDAFVDQWNAGKIQAGTDVRLMPLRRTGFLALDFVIPNPGLDGEHESDVA